MEHRIEVVTNPLPDGRIVQETFGAYHGVREQMICRIIDTQEQQIREALITLGWTPPATEGEPK